MILELSKGHEFRSNLFEATILLFLFTEPNYSNEVNLRLTRRSGSAGVTGSSYNSIALFGGAVFSSTYQILTTRLFSVPHVIFFLASFPILHHVLRCVL